MNYGLGKMNRLRLAARKRDELIVAAAARDCFNKVVLPFGLAILARKSQVATKINALFPVRELYDQIEHV